jgi:hypothetical protein
LGTQNGGISSAASDREEEIEMKHISTELTPIHAAYVAYVLALTTKANTALQIVSQCDQCAANRITSGYTKLDGNELQLCEPCRRGTK